MGVIHDPPCRPTKGKFRIIRAIPENIGSCMLQMSVAKMTGQRARRSTIAGVGLVAKVRKMFPVCPFRPTQSHGWFVAVAENWLSQDRRSRTIEIRPGSLRYAHFPGSGKRLRFLMRLNALEDGNHDVGEHCAGLREKSHGLAARKPSCCLVLSSDCEHACSSPRPG